MDGSGGMESSTDTIATAPASNEDQAKPSVNYAANATGRVL
jgi:hypothetical protein